MNDCALIRMYFAKNQAACTKMINNSQVFAITNGDVLTQEHDLAIAHNEEFLSEFFMHSLKM